MAIQKQKCRVCNKRFPEDEGRVVYDLIVTQLQTLLDHVEVEWDRLGIKVPDRRKVLQENLDKAIVQLTTEAPICSKCYHRAGKAMIDRVANLIVSHEQMLSGLFVWKKVNK